MNILRNIRNYFTRISDEELLRRARREDTLRRVMVAQRRRQFNNVDMRLWYGSFYEEGRDYYGEQLGKDSQPSQTS